MRRFPGKFGFRIYLVDKDALYWRRRSDGYTNEVGVIKHKGNKYIITSVTYAYGDTVDYSDKIVKAKNFSELKKLVHKEMEEFE